MKASTAIIALVLSFGCGRAPEPAPPVASAPDPAQVVRAMFDTLAGARQLTFKATRRLDAALVIGGSVAESAEIEVWVSRPNTYGHGRCRMPAFASSTLTGETCR